MSTTAGLTIHTVGSTQFTATSTEASPALGTNNSSSSNPTTSSNSLYLYTFLTTLLLLLGVSCGIIFRSFVLRRRFRQRVEEAIAAGVLLPDGRLAPAAGGSRRGNVFGAKPVLWEVWMERPEEKVEEWDNIQPISATRIHNMIPAPVVPVDLPAAVPPPPQPRFDPRRMMQGILRHRQPEPTPEEPAQAQTIPRIQVETPSQTQLPSRTATLEGAAPESDKLVLSVLIAMPNPNRATYDPIAERSGSSEHHHSTSDSSEQDTASIKGKSKLPNTSGPSHFDHPEDDELPDVVIGVVEVPWANDDVLPHKNQSNTNLENSSLEGSS